MIVLRSLHNIDLPNRQIVPKTTIPVEFNGFMEEFVRFATENNSIKYYRVHDENTQIFSCIAKIAYAYLSLEQPEYESIFAECSNSIADKLYRVEAETQIRIEAMGRHIKRGSLVQAFIRNGLELQYVIAKVEHQEWYDGDSFIKNLGFPSDKKNVWKSAVIPFSIEDGTLSFETIRVYTDNPAVYWTSSFLEVDEVESDEATTTTVYSEIHKELERSLKKKSLSDFLLLRNYLIKEMKTEQEMDYYELIDRLTMHYIPEKEDLDLGIIREHLKCLPEKKKFNTRFRTVPKAIKAHKTYRFFPISGVELSLKDSVENMRESIVSYQDERGDRFLRIICLDNNVYSAFQRRSNS